MALFRRKTVEPTEEPVETVEALPQPPAGDDQGRRSVQTYRDYLLSLVPPLEPFGMGITDALGLAVCENVPSPIDVPRRTVASFDGYALMASSTKSAGRPDKLRLQLDRRPPVPIIGGTVVSIQGGQELPRGADAVVSENHMVNGEVVLSQPVRRWDGCTLAGSDYLSGESLMENGEILHVGLAALLSRAGIDRVLARPRPRIVVIGTGNGHSHEAIPDLDVTARTVTAAVHARGFDAWRVECLGDDRERLTQTISDQFIRADLVIATGDRMTAGGYDPIAAVLHRFGPTEFSQVAMAPSGMHGFALAGAGMTPVLMLPPGPAPALTSLLCFGLPLMRKLAGMDVNSDRLTGQWRHDVQPDPALTTFRAVTCIDAEGGPQLTVLDTGDVASLPLLAAADAIAVLPPGEQAIAAGSAVSYWRLDA